MIAEYKQYWKVLNPLSFNFLALFLLIRVVFGHLSIFDWLKFSCSNDHNHVCANVQFMKVVIYTLLDFLDLSVPFLFVCHYDCLQVHAPPLS